MTDWQEVVAGTNTPVANPNGVLEPGEGALVRLTLSFTPEVGQLVSYNQPPPGGVARVAGLSNAAFSVIATNANGGAWSHPAMHSGFLGGFSLVDPPTGTIMYASVYQLITPPSSFPLPTNPLPNAWSAVWTPPNYQPRMVTLDATPGLHAASLFVHTGEDPNGNPTFGFAEAIPNDYGLVNILVVPSPGAGVVLGLGFAVFRRSRNGV